MPSSSHILLPLLFMSVFFIYTSTSLLTYNFNQPIQLRRLLKMDPRRQMALIRLSDSMKRYEPSQMFVDLVDAQSAQNIHLPLQPPKGQQMAVVDSLAPSVKKWGTFADTVYWSGQKLIAKDGD
uniref:Uncharacterized protein n=1 Tax=Globodera rostochiensis TaxID=31243 RepID=A0A914HT61_GLORO